MLKNILTSLKTPALVGLALTLPLILLELFNRWSFQEDFPFPLFGMLWLLASTFCLVLLPLAQKLRARSNLLAQPVGLAVQVGLLFVIAAAWTGILLDQWPCFMGVPLCD